MATQKFFLSRTQGLIGLAGSACFSLIIDYLLFKSLGNGQLVPAIVLVVLALAALFSMIGFGRLAFFPSVLFEANQDGLTSYFNAEKGQFRPIGNMVPWVKMKKVSPYTNGKISAVQIDLAKDHNLPVAVLSIVRPIEGEAQNVDWENTIFLRGESDFGSLQQLADELEKLRTSAQR